MTEAAQTTTETLLGALRANRHAAADLEVERLELTVDWAVENTVEADGEWAAHQVSLFGDRALPIAGPGAPLVSEFALMEYAAALGMSTDSGKAYVGKTLELRYRLPRLWEQVVSGRLPVWRAMRVAEQTGTLPMAAAADVDRALAPAAGTCSWAQIGRLVEEALARHDPQEAEDRRRRSADGRRFDVETDRVDTTGTVLVERLASTSPTPSTSRPPSAGRPRSWPSSAPPTPSTYVARWPWVRSPASSSPSTSTPARSDPGHGRSVVLNVHLTEAAIAGIGGNVARCGNTRTPVLLDQVTDWCQSAGQITVVPIKDLGAHHHVEAYEIPDRIKTQIELLNHTCVFPHCHRRAEACDHDHIDPHATRRHAAGRRARTTSRPCADDTTAPRPTADGATGGSIPPATSGRLRTATGSCVTTTAPTPRSRPTPHPTSPDHPAPTPDVPTTTSGAPARPGRLERRD